MQYVLYAYFLVAMGLCGAEASQYQNYQTGFPIVHNYLDKFGDGVDYSNLCELVNILGLKRTGTTLTYSILTQLTGRYCLWSTKGSRWEEAVLLNRALSNIGNNSFPILGSHFLEDFQGCTQGKLIMTVRNYLDYFSRFMNPGETFDFNRMRAQIELYVQYLDFFDKWNAGEKLLIYFEDLMHKPFEVIQEMGKFVNANDVQIDGLLRNYDNFSSKVFDSYTHFPGGTEGKNSNHSAKISKKQAQQLEKMIQNLDPYLFEKYLVRYKLSEAA